MNGSISSAMKTAFPLLAVMFLVSGCDTFCPGPPSCLQVQSDIDIAALEQAMANPQRPAADKERDASRRAPEVLHFLGLRKGMTVLDINASAGWYTEVLSYAVGDEGKVYMQNRPGGRNEEAANARAARLPNVEQVDAISDVPAFSVDFAFTALNFHDFHNSDPARAQEIVKQIRAVLKSGATLGVVDHEGSPGADNTSLHRITYDDAVAAIHTDHALEFVSSSNLLDNPADDHTKSPFDESLGRNTDRIVLRFEEFSEYGETHCSLFLGILSRRCRR